MQDIPNECLLDEATLVTSDACDSENKESKGNFPIFDEALFPSCENCNPKEEKREKQQYAHLYNARRENPNNHSIGKPRSQTKYNDCKACCQIQGFLRQFK